MKLLSPLVLRIALIPLLISSALVGSASAQTTYYWDGNGATTGAGTNPSGTWGGASDSGFWSTSPTGTTTTSSTGPGTLDTAVFTAWDGTAGDGPSGAYTVTLGASQSLTGIVIGTASNNTSDGVLTLATTASYTLTIGSGGITLNGSSGDPSITGALILGASQTWTINNAHVLAVGASVAGSATGGNTDTLSLGYVGQYTPTLGGVISDGTAGGNVAITLNNTNGTSTGGGIWEITGSNNSYTGATSISRGVLEVGGSLANAGSNSSLGAATGANSIINFGSGTYGGTLIYSSGTNSSSNRGINLAGTTGGATIYQNGSGYLNLSGALSSAGGTNTLTLGGTSTTGTNTFSGLISDGSGSGAGNLSIVVTGPASWNISNSNTIAGTLTTSNTESTYTGTLTMNGNNTFNNGGTDVSVAGGTVIMNGSNSFNGNVAVSGGILTLGGANSGFGNYNVTGGVLNLNSNNDGVGTLSVSGGGTVSMGANATLASANVSLNGGFLLLGGAGNVGGGNSITIGTSGGGIGVTYTPTSFPTFTDNSGTTGGIFGIGYVGTGGIGSVSNITALFGSSSYWSLGAFTGSNGTYTGTVLPVGALNTYRLGGGGGVLTIQNAFLTGSGNNLQIGSATGGTVDLPTGETYGGTTTIFNGIAGITSGSSFGTSSSAINVGSGTNAVGINYLGTGETISRALNFAGTTGSVTLSNSGTGNVVYSGTPVFDSAGNKTLVLGNATDTYGGSIGAITNSGTGTTTVVKNGAANSVWILTGGSGNTYTGNTTVNGGVLQTTNFTDLSNSYINLAGTSTADPGILQTQGTITRTLSSTASTSNINMNEYGGFAAYGGTLTLDFGGGTALSWGSGFANGSSGGTPAVFGSTTSNNQVILENNLSLNTTDPFQQYIYVYKGTGGDSTLFSGVISNGTGTGAASGIVKTGLGTLILSNANNSYSGYTTVGQGTLIAAANTPAAGVGVTGAFGSGDGPSATPSTVYATIALGISATGTGGNPSLLIGGAYSLARPISITDYGTNNVYSIGGSTNATATFANAISFTNASQGSTGNTFDITQVATTGSNTLNITGGITAVSLTGTQTVTFANVGAVSVNTTGITNGNSTLAVLQSGAGTTTLAAANTYTGATTINGGVLKITGSTVSTGTVVVNSGGTLAGTGGGAINLADGVIGTLTIGSLTTTGGGSLSFEIGGVTTSTDVIADTGALTASGSTTINVANLGGISQTIATGTYTILSYTGTSQSLSNFTLSTTSLDGKSLALTQNGDTIEIAVTSNTASTTYTLSTTAGSTLLHSGATTTLTTTVTNTGTGTADTLDYSGLGATATNGSVSGSTTTGGPLANNSVGTGTNTQTYTATTAGSDTISATGSGTNATQGGSATLSTSTGTTINVYSGVGVWNTNGGGSWGAVSATPTNWTANGGTPGVTAGFVNTDSASFGSILASGTGSVTLDGENPSLNAITFDDSAASYVIAQGTGTGSITLDGNGGNANVTDLAGAHTISAPIDLATSANVDVASGQQLTISGTVSGTGGLVNNGSGTTILSGNNGYSGGTTVSSGTLQLSNSSGSATGSGALNVGAGAVLAGTGFSNGSSFSITGNSSTVATVLVGHNTASDLNTTGVMSLSATGASSIGSANLVFNINSNVAGQGNELNVGTTAITFNTVGTMKTTLTLNVEGTTYINGYTTYVLVAGTGTTTIAGNGTTSGQYSGLTTFLNSKGQEEIETGATSNLALAFSSPTQAGFYAPSYLFLVNNGGVDDIEVEVVPEPGTWAMMLGGLAMLIVWQRRKSKLS